MGQIELREIGQSIELLQPGVGHLRVAQAEDREIGQALEVRQPDSAHPRVVQIENREFGESFKKARTSSGVGSSPTRSR